MIADCYTEKERKNFLDGLNELDTKSKDTFKKSFVEISQDERNVIFKSFEAEAFEKQAKNKAKVAQQEKKKAENQAEVSNKEKSIAVNDQPYFPHPYFMLKDLTVLGYFTSEIGCKEALEYVPIPGKYIGCTPLKPGQKAWALN